MQYTEFMTWAFVVYVIYTQMLFAAKDPENKGEDYALQAFVWSACTWACFSAVYGVYLFGQMVWHHWIS